MSKSTRPEDFEMPAAYRGQIVLWYQNGVVNDDTACPALVKVDGRDSLHLKVFAIDCELDYTCVRHVSDPNAKEYDKIQNGTWDFVEPDPLHVKKVAAKPIKNPLRGDAVFDPDAEDKTAL